MMRNKIHTIQMLKESARLRIPKFAMEYLEAGTEGEKLLKNNRSQFDDISFIPKFLNAAENVSLETSFLGELYSAPIGIAPVGLSGLIWPRAESFMVKAAFNKNIPYCLSTVATMSPEELNSKSSLFSKNKWFQLYPPADRDILDSLLFRAKENKYSSLVVTVDIPTPSRRERAKKAGILVPFKINFKLVTMALTKPKWLLETLYYGVPRLRIIEKYSTKTNLRFVSNFAGNRLGGIISEEYLREIRSKWNGKLIIKGILHTDDALLAKSLGYDAIYISNHGGRQFDGNSKALQSLIDIRKIVGPNYPLIYDSGIRSGLDILKALYLGADMVFAGRPFLYGLASRKQKGIELAYDILADQLKNNMHQLAIPNINEIRSLSKTQVVKNI